MKTVELARIRHKAGSLSFERLPDCLIFELRVLVRLGIGHTLVQKPCIQLVVSLETQTGCEEPFAHQPNLILDLALLPSRAAAQRSIPERAMVRRSWRVGGGSTGHRLDQEMAAHLKKAPIVSPLLTDKHRFHRRLQIIVNAPLASALEEGKGSVVGIEKP